MFHIPSYSELSAKKIWPLIQKDEELIKYFPKYKPQQIPNKDYLFTILCSLRPVEANQLLCTAMKNRSIYEDRLEGDYIKISNKWQEEIKNVVDLPSKINKIIV